MKLQLEDGTYVGVGVFYYDIGGNLLLGNRVDGQGYCVPGGSVEVGETPRDAALRELEEETGIKHRGILRFVGKIGSTAVVCGKRSCIDSYIYMATENLQSSYPESLSTLGIKDTDTEELTEIRYYTQTEVSEIIESCKMFLPTRVAFDKVFAYRSIKVIETDCDGVLLDIYSPLVPIVTKIDPEFKLSDMVSWSLDELKPSTKGLILKKFHDAEYIGNLTEYPGAFTKFNSIAGLGYHMKINTSVCAMECVPRRTQHLIPILHNLHGIKISTDPVKSMHKSVDLTIDDSVKNMLNSPSRFRVIITQHHNKDLPCKHLLEYGLCVGEIIRADSYVQFAQYILGEV